MQDEIAIVDYYVDKTGSKHPIVIAIIDTLWFLTALDPQTGDTCIPCKEDFEDGSWSELVFTTKYYYDEYIAGLDVWKDE